MKKFLAYILASLFFIACKLQPGSDRQYDGNDPAKIYKVGLNPVKGSSYHYDIINKTEVTLEAEGKEVNNFNRSEIGLMYQVDKDSAGNFLLSAKYEKIKLHTKNGDTETEADAANAKATLNPTEKMLGILQSANIIATVSPNGEVLAVSGYKELEEKILAAFSGNEDDEDMPHDHNDEEAAQQLKKVVGDGIIKNTMDQLFKIFPDSAIHLGDTWKLNEKIEGEIPMVSKGFYKLRSIHDDVAVISVEGSMMSSNVSKNIMGINGATANIKGDQKGEYEVEIKTGMIIKGNINANIKGSIIVMGKEIPITIKTEVKLLGKNLSL